MTVLERRRGGTISAATWGTIALVAGLCVGGALAFVPALLLLAVAVLVAVAALRLPSVVLVAAIPVLVLPDPAIGIGVPLDSLVALTLGGVWVLGLVQGRWAFLWRAHGPLALLAVWLVVAWRLHPPPESLASSASSSLTTLLLGLLLCAVAVSIRPDPSSVIAATALTGFLVAVLTLTGDPAPDGRGAALGLNSNYVGIVLALGLTAAVAMAVSVSRAPGRALWLVPAAGQIGALLSTQSRGAYAAGAAGIVVLVLVGRARWVQLASGAAIVIVVLLLPGEMTAIADAGSGDRTTEDLTFSDDIRYRAARVAASYSIEHPLFGIGYGSFPEAGRQDDRLSVFLNTHNDYLRLSAEAGLPALGFFLALVSVVLGLRARRALDRGVLAVLTTYLVALLFANTLASLQMTGPFWVLLGSAASLASTGVPRSSREGRVVAGR